jgi:hypothetical protein
MITAQMQIEVEKWQKRVEELIPKPTVYSIDGLFEHCYEGDFEWDGSEVADNYPWFCDECNAWHLQSYALVLKRIVYRREIELIYSSCNDGYWQSIATWEEGDDWKPFADELKQLDTWHYWKGWMDYCLWVVENNQDPLNNFTTTELNARVDAFIENAKAYYELCYHDTYEKTGYCRICGSSGVNGYPTCEHEKSKLVWQ